MPDLHAMRAAAPRGKRSIAAWSCAVAAMATLGWGSVAIGGGFLKIPGVPGESTNDQHKDEIEILTYDVAIAVPTSSTGRATGKVSCPPVTFYKRLDKSSVLLAKKLAQGVHMPQAVLTFQKGGEPPTDFFIVKMTEVFITEFS